MEKSKMYTIFGIIAAIMMIVGTISVVAFESNTTGIDKDTKVTVADNTTKTCGCGCQNKCGGTCGSSTCSSGGTCKVKV